MGYLAWVLEEADHVRDSLRAAIRDELVRRLDLEPEVRTVTLLATPPQELAPIVREVVRSGFRTLSLTSHPDRGGSNVAMRKLLETREWFEQHVCGATR